VEESYAALKWVAEHAGELGADGSRIAVAGNSVGGNMTAALTLISKDRTGPKISYQALLIPATDASADTESYKEYGTGRFLARAFMKYGWDLYAAEARTRDNPYVSPLRASIDQLKGLPPALVLTADCHASVASTADVENDASQISSPLLQMACGCGGVAKAHVLVRRWPAAGTPSASS
jgi:acetyl esterase/lipase